MRFRRRLNTFIAATLVCGTAVVFAGCGGGDDSSGEEISPQNAEAAKAVLALGTEVQAAIDERDAKAVCGMFDPEGVKKRFKTDAGCIKGINAIFNRDTEVPEYSFDEVTVTGDTAIAKNKADDADVYFKKVGDRWYFDLYPPAETVTVSPTE